MGANRSTDQSQEYTLQSQPTLEFAKREDALSWIFGSITVDEFFSQYWSKEAYVVHREREDCDYFKSLFSREILEYIVRTHKIAGWNNFNAKKYVDGEIIDKTPHNEVVDYQTLQDMCDNQGCTIQFLQPQQYVPDLKELNRNLEELFGNLVGSNIYLTPPNSQGLAPHYDLVDVFVLQIQGSKHWRVYDTPNEERMPNLNSPMFKREHLGDPILETTLESGDVIYLPKGFIHEADAKDEFSIHVTISTYQYSSWHYFLKRAFSSALESAMHEDIEFREHLPVNSRDFMGLVHEKEKPDLNQEQFTSQVSRLVEKTHKYIMRDMHRICDDIVLDFVTQRLPGKRSRSSKKHTEELREDHKICIENPEYLRLVQTSRIMCNFEDCEIHEHSEGKDNPDVELFHCFDNNASLHMTDISDEVQTPFLRFSFLEGETIKYLMSIYPEFVSISSLPLESLEMKLKLCGELHTAGLLLVEYSGTVLRYSRASQNFVPPPDLE